MTEGGLFDEFVTVGVAAKRLGVADRTAQRYAAKLSDSDRQVSDTGGPQLVRLSAMQTRAKEAAARTVTAGVRHTDASVSDSDAPGGGQVSDTSAGAMQAAFVAQLQGEVAFLRDALKTEQENTRAALAELHEARRESQVLIAATASGRLHINAAATATAEPAGETEQGAAKGQVNEARDMSESDKILHSKKSAGELQEAWEGSVDATGDKASTPWWAFWKAKEGR